MPQLLVNKIRGYGLGYIPDAPDRVDLTWEDPAVKPVFEKFGVLGLLEQREKLPGTVDLKSYFPPVYDQGSLNSCTAQVGAALMAYYQQRGYKTSVQLSRLFIYKIARDLVFQSYDLGAYMRTTFETLIAFGACPEAYWPYVPQFVNSEPPAFNFALGGNYRTWKAYCFDRGDVAKDEVLDNLKAALAVGFPVGFGFLVFPSIDQSWKTGEIPFPGPDEQFQGGHALVAVGYDDSLKIQNSSGGEDTTGAFLVRNSWGESWGQDGYGWLPYKYLLEDYASDWWSIINADFLNLDAFGPQPANKP